MHLLGFIISIYHGARSSECQIDSTSLYRLAAQIIVLQLAEIFK